MLPRYLLDIYVEYVDKYKRVLVPDSRGYFIRVPFEDMLHDATSYLQLEKYDSDSKPDVLEGLNKHYAHIPEHSVGGSIPRSFLVALTCARILKHSRKSKEKPQK